MQASEYRMEESFGMEGLYKGLDSNQNYIMKIVSRLPRLGLILITVAINQKEQLSHVQLHVTNLKF